MDLLKYMKIIKIWFDIEMKLQGAILFIMLNFFIEEKLIPVFNEINKNNESIEKIIKIIIISFNPKYSYIYN